MDVLEQDGKNHIRIDNRGRTELGKMLDSQYISMFIHPTLGLFNTTEGFWYYISLIHRVELLRTLSGCECRRYIKQLKAENRFKKANVPNFYEHIRYANWLKIEQNREGLKKKFIESHLPFRMYYINEEIDDSSYSDETERKTGLIHVASCHPRLSNIIQLREWYKEDNSLLLQEPDVSAILKTHSQNTQPV